MPNNKPTYHIDMSDFDDFDDLPNDLDNNSSAKASAKRLNPAQIKEQQQAFAILHFLYFDLDDFLGITEDKTKKE